MDFVVSLPAFQGNTIIMAVVHRFSKAGNFGMLPTQFTACKASELFTTMIYKLHGYPKSIITGKDRTFLSKFCQTSFKLNGTKLRMSIPYNIQTSGQTEALSRGL